MKNVVLARQCAFVLPDGRELVYGDPAVIDDDLYNAYKDYFQVIEDVPEDKPNARTKTRNGK